MALNRFKTTINWQKILTVSGFIIVLLILYGYKLNSLINGHGEELTRIHSKIEFSQIIDNPIFGPYQLLLVLLAKVNWLNLLSLRLLSAICALIVIGLFYYCLKNWFKPRIAMMTTVMLASSASLLRLGRFGSPLIALALGIALLALAIGITKHKTNDRYLMAVAVILGFLLYIPYIFWFLTLILVWKGRLLWKRIKDFSNYKILVAYLILLIIILPLVIAFVRNQSLLINYLGLNNYNFSLVLFIKRVFSVLSDLVFHSTIDSRYRLNQLPILDIFSSFMLIVGLISCVLKRGLQRSQLILGCFILSILVSAAAGAPADGLLLVFSYLLVGEGLAYFLGSWFKVFPKNPVAGKVGIIIVGCLVSLTLIYNLANYFRAWPNSQLTKSQFTGQLK